jgi:hypothetical protein
VGDSEQASVENKSVRSSTARKREELKQRQREREAAKLKLKAKTSNVPDPTELRRYVCRKGKSLKGVIVILQIIKYAFVQVC